MSDKKIGPVVVDGNNVKQGMVISGLNVDGRLNTVELRALLDNSVIESQYDGMTQDQAQAVSDGVDEILHGKPAAQQQGEPVAWVIQWGSVIPGFQGHREAVLKDPSPLDAEITPLYAEQPAPVAHTMRSVMDAAQQARGFPVLTSNQCHALAEALNGVKP